MYMVKKEISQELMKEFNVIAKFYNLDSFERFEKKNF